MRFQDPDVSMVSNLSSEYTLGGEGSGLEARWAQLQQWALRHYGRIPDVQGLLFLIGLRELGQGYVPDLDKRRKEHIVMEGIYCALAALGHYARVGIEGNGHWIWEPRAALPGSLSETEETPAPSRCAALL